MPKFNNIMSVLLIVKYPYYAFANIMGDKSVKLSMNASSPSNKQDQGQK